MDDIYYHICVYPIIFEARPEDDGGAPVFRDGEQPDDPAAEAIDVCPNLNGSLCRYPRPVRL